ncbi:MAG: glutathione S-transferase [Candidatus Dadabacteria bacterium RIFCSPHIGHO2_12_FULL_53_21]|nr:MAG: glutathione S-transferase [Candidatus Dadabacteria bacterium RIFCSPHIGHO2_12_FULL_53_21]
MAKPVLVIGNKNYSSWSMRPWLALRHLGIGFDEVRIPLYGEGSSEEIRKYSPSGKVPVYIDGGVRVWDSIAILEFLAEKHPSLWPADAGARAHARSVCAEMHSGFAALRSTLPMNARAGDRWVELGGDAVGDAERVLEIWETCRGEHGKAGPWLFGSFTAADAMYAPVVLRFHTYGIEAGGLSKGYMETVLSDEHVLEWISGAEQEEEVIEKFEKGIY